MDSGRFDSLARALGAEPTRRGLLRGLAGTAFGLTALKHPNVVSAKKRRKKKRKDSGPCEPDCIDKNCGDDGCGESCGPCARGTCEDGICVCPQFQELCRGACEVVCLAPRLRHPTTCDCCRTNGTARLFFDGCGDCCSGNCYLAQPPGNPHYVCQGRDSGFGCEFDAQCESGDCQDTGPGAGTCA